jgi:glycosyltransferase involved in cell wall biosynthesis
MQITYDAHIFLEQKAGGISRYHYELYKGMRQLEHDVRIAGLFVKNRYLLSDKQAKKHFINDPTASFAVFNKWILINRLKKIKSNEIFHPARDYEYLTGKISDINMVFTIHDMIAEKDNPDKIRNKLYFAQNARKIIAVSESTKKDIVNLLGIDRKKIEVVYHGASLYPQMANKLPHAIPDSFLLYVGDRNGYKNFRTLAKSIVKLLKKRSDLYLVCAGKKNFSTDEKLFLKELGINNKTLCFPLLTDNELAYLYCKALAFVFPSINEGFGIPVLEAWACGTPVALSSNDCFVEIAAEAGEFFDPHSEESILDTIEKIILNKPLRKELIERGNRRLQSFSWEKTVLQTNEIYKSLL